MSRALEVLGLAFCLVCVPGCDVEQDLGDGDAGVRDGGLGASSPGPLEESDGQIVDSMGNAIDAGPDDLVASSTFCSTADLTTCLAHVSLLDRFEAGSLSGASSIMFDDAGNQYRSFAMNDVPVRLSYSPSNEKRWSSQGGETTALELGGERLCVYTLDTTLLPGFAGRELNEPTGYSSAIACYDTFGRPLWWRYLELGTWFLVDDYAVDGAGNVYVAGQIQLEQGTSYDAFVAQILASGELGWLRAFEGPEDERAIGVAAGPTGLVVLGWMPSQITIGDVTLEHHKADTTSGGILDDAGGTWLASLTFDGEPVFGVALQPTEDTRERSWDHALWLDGQGGVVIAIEWLDGWRDIARIDASGAIEIEKLETLQPLDDLAGLIPYGAGYVLAGTCQDERGVADGCLILLDGELEELSSARYGRSYAHGDAAKLEGFDSIALGPDGALYVGGRTSDRRDFDPHNPFFARIAAAAP